MMTAILALAFLGEGGHDFWASFAAGMVVASPVWYFVAWMKQNAWDAKHEGYDL
jgi:hypothetical protein